MTCYFIITKHAICVFFIKSYFFGEAAVRFTLLPKRYEKKTSRNVTSDGNSLLGLPVTLLPKRSGRQPDDRLICRLSFGKIFLIYERKKTPFVTNNICYAGNGYWMIRLVWISKVCLFFIFHHKSWIIIIIWFTLTNIEENKECWHNCK